MRCFGMVKQKYPVVSIRNRRPSRIAVKCPKSPSIAVAGPNLRLQR